MEQLLQLKPKEIGNYVSSIQEFISVYFMIQNLKEFDSKQLTSVFRKCHLMKQERKVYQYKIDLKELPLLKAENIDMGLWDGKNIITLEINEKRKELEEWRNQLVENLKQIGKKERKSKTILQQFELMNPKFPVNLQRLAELVNLPKEETEEVLKYTLEKHPEIGQYDGMTQMFIFSQTRKKKKEKDVKKKVKCPECKAEQKSTTEKCSNCGKEFNVCPICGGIITTEKTKECSSCGRLFHKIHIEEWMNTNRNCPICKKSL